MEAAFPIIETPKRKRGEHTISISPPPLAFSFDPAVVHPASPDHGFCSISSSIAHRFSGLMLEGGVGVPAEDADVDAEASAPKRQKHDHHVMQQTMRPQMQVRFQKRQQQEEPGSKPGSSSVASESTPIEQNPSPQPSSPREISPRRAYSSGNRLSEAKSRARRRAGTPPLRSTRANPPGTSKPGLANNDDDDADLTDPVRGALTWHEDEITVYDPNDKDDDGTGVNGIGFKPSPALAQARLMKRRQQLAEYRRREESDARAKRNQRRRGEILAARRENKSPQRRVRFTDVEGRNIAVKTG